MIWQFRVKSNSNKVENKLKETRNSMGRKLWEMKKKQIQAKWLEQAERLLTQTGPLEHELSIVQFKPKQWTYGAS
jgi:tRNA A22 N-methylase